MVSSFSSSAELEEELLEEVLEVLLEEELEDLELLEELEDLELEELPLELGMDDGIGTIWHEPKTKGIMDRNKSLLFIRDSLF